MCIRDRDYQVELEASCLSGQSFSYHSSKREKASYQVALLGHHQARNAALAISICDVPVSYTHLDVYKRQQWGCVGLSRLD